MKKATEYLEEKKVSEHLKEKLKDPEFKRLFEAEQQKLKIAKVLINYRIKHNLSQKELAKKLGVTQQYISKIENGDFSKLGTVKRILFTIGYRIELEIEPLPKSIKKRMSENLLKGKFKGKKHSIS